MEREFNQDGVDIKLLQDAPPPRKRRRRSGPCFFRCPVTCNAGYLRAQLWKAVPEGTAWEGAPSGATLCTTCYGKMQYALGKMQGKPKPISRQLDVQQTKRARKQHPPSNSALMGPRAATRQQRAVPETVQT